MKTCPKCNAVNNDVNLYCEACGAELNVVNEAPVEPSVEAPQPQYQPPQFQQPPYMPVQFNENMLPEEYKPVSVGKYIGYSFLFSLPIVGFIMLLVTAFSGNTNKSLKNFARAQLILTAIAVVFLIIYMVVIVGLLGSDMMGGLYY